VHVAFALSILDDDEVEVGTEVLEDTCKKSFSDGDEESYSSHFPENSATLYPDAIVRPLRRSNE
jgi:hypothetical protein